MPKKLTLKQEKFVDIYVKTGNATESAMQVYNCKSREVAKSIGPENLAKPCIKAEIKNKIQVAKDIIYEIAMHSDNESLQLRACQDILDRTEGKATQKIITEPVENERPKEPKLNDEQMEQIALRILKNKQKRE